MTRRERRPRFEGFGKPTASRALPEPVIISRFTITWNPPARGSDFRATFHPKRPHWDTPDP